MPKSHVRVTIRKHVPRPIKHRVQGSGKSIDAQLQLTITVNGIPEGEFMVGVRISADDRIEFRRPGGYDGPYDHDSFCLGIARFYRRTGGFLPHGPQDGFDDAASHLYLPFSFEFSVDSDSSAWW